MIQWFLDWLSGAWRGVWSSLVALIPDPPSWWSSLDLSWASTFVTEANRWVPVTIVLTVGASILAFQIIAFGIVATRRIVSLFTGGGGNA